MAIRSGHESSRDASTYFEVVERFEGYALLNVLPKPAERTKSVCT